MTGLLFCLSAAAMGVDYGWQPVAGGGIEYIIQIDPALLDSLKDGSDLFSDLPSSVNVRRYRITVGNERLPHHGEPPPAVVPASGQSPRGGQAGERAEPAEIDMSQLPGPVLRPALVLDAPAKKTPTNEAQTNEQEPQRLADSDGAAPLGGRVTGFRQQREQPASNKTAHGPPAREKDDRDQPRSTESKTQNTSEKERGAAAEPESPSDKPSAKPDESLASKTALTQIGLFTSLCCNVFLLWVATGQRSRYRALVRRMFEGSGATLTGSDSDPPRWERLPAPVKEGATGASGDDS
ncbi:MAG TPA: hypothetical protein VG125_19480 [Pirellulales bacterium]|jgi:hypothetical protein|nr:hypothetical protein [Pirellulales bacterium]